MRPSRGKCSDSKLKANKKYRDKNRLKCNAASNKSYYKNSAHHKKVMQGIREKRKLNRQCTSCGRPLVEGEKLTCVNCGNTMKGERTYAASTARASKNL
jgi:predicted RNA-binding Zn-ribbon protein involved in translation (DUF1610 family)